MSVAVRKSTPAPMQTECTAAKTGFVHDSIDDTDSCHCLMWGDKIAALRTTSPPFLNCSNIFNIVELISNPAVKTLPTPEKTTARQSASSLSFSKQCLISFHIGPLMAFSLPGRLSWTWKTNGRGCWTRRVSYL